MGFSIRKILLILGVFSVLFIKPLLAITDTSVHVSVFGGEFWPFKNEFEEAALAGGRITFNASENLEAGVDISFMQSDDKFNLSLILSGEQKRII